MNRTNYRTLPPPTRTLLSVSFVALLSSGCSFEPPPDVPGDDDAPIDAAAEPDMMPVECEANTTTCDDAMERYVECGPDGVSTRVVECPLGCASDAEVCLDVAASNGLSGYLDQARDDDTAVSVTFAGASTIDTDTGDVSNAGVPVEVPTTTTNGIRVFMFKDLDVVGTLKVTGSFPVALVADGVVAITGAIDVSADGTTLGPGAVTTGDCAGIGTGNISSNPIPGGGGGGHFEMGASGGDAFDGTDGGAGGAPRPDPDLDPLAGGCVGGSATILTIPSQTPNGGGGGGAIQIVARRSISVSGGGTIDASGGGGTGPGSNAGGGGGSGGSVLLEAPAIELSGAGVVLSTKGGGGGSGGGGGAGEDGGTSADVAAGGAASARADGGTGGTESVAPTRGQTATTTTNNRGGGGGGSVGQARFNTRSAAITPADGAAIRSHYSVGEIGSRHMQF